MSMFVWQLEYERRREKEFGIPSLNKGFYSLGEQSERTKRENSVETKVLNTRLHLIRREEAAYRYNSKKEIDSLEKLKVSIRSPVSAPLKMAEIREFQSRLGYRPSGGNFAGTVRPVSGDAGGYQSRQLPSCLEARKKRSSPEALREMQRKADGRAPRSVGRLRSLYTDNEHRAKTAS